MKVLGIIFFIMGICFSVVGLIGHSAAWAAACLSFFAATMTIVAQRGKKDDTE